MGQAKQRGTLTQRQQAAILTNEVKAIEDVKKAYEIEKAMTPEQKAARHKTRMLLATIAGLGSIGSITGI